MKYLSGILAACAPLTSSGFVVRPALHTTFAVQMSKVETLDHLHELSEVDEFCVENVAEFCLNSSCDVEEYEALINQLQEQRDIMAEHVEKLDSLLGRLKGVESEVSVDGSKSADEMQAAINTKLGLGSWAESVQSP
uniref:Uncharacterized protein n=1 Tax=Pseudictyota dubia TaxID=2749911 RepID=A0A7R9W5N0_9STRA|mmetsp:Transcript_34249/g.63334  ORF Transcript_34249/g.63334 Transcript_34249/m.63334 type:complete len:137 (+) Transcript_34249:138-548(+)